MSHYEENLFYHDTWMSFYKEERRALHVLDPCPSKAWFTTCNMQKIAISKNSP